MISEDVLFAFAFLQVGKYGKISLRSGEILIVFDLNLLCTMRTGQFNDSRRVSGKKSFIGGEL